jgi:hypothetical protein
MRSSSRCRKLQKDAKKAVKPLKRIQEGNNKGFNFEEVVIEGLDDFESQETEGFSYGNDAPLEKPIQVTTVKAPEKIEAVRLRAPPGHGDDRQKGKNITSADLVCYLCIISLF